ncbi:Orf V, partial [Mucuna pruriens]
MPQGLKNAPSEFQNIMNDIFNKYAKFSLVYLDDVLIFSKNLNEHIEYLEKFINLIKENGCVNYIAEFIPNIKIICAPLYKRLRKNPLEWTNEMTKVIIEIKILVKKLPCLGIPDPNAELIIEIDASDIGHKGILKQKLSNSSKEQVVKYHSDDVFNKKFLIRTDCKAAPSVLTKDVQNLSAEITHTRDDQGNILFSKMKIMNIFSPQVWNQNLFDSKTFSRQFNPSGYTYYDYIDAWYNTSYALMSSSSTRVSQWKVWKGISEAEASRQCKKLAWIACTDALPVKSKLLERGAAQDDKCPCCNDGHETVFHALLQCEEVRRFWFASPLGLRTDLLGGVATLSHWINECIDVLDHTRMGMVCAMMWALWHKRNAWFLQQTKLDCEQVLQKATAALLPDDWRPPPEPFVKANFGVLVKASVGTGMGVVYRDSMGAVLASSTLLFSFSFSLVYPTHIFSLF